MLEFSDAPYRFFEAQPSAPLIWLGRRLNRHMILPGPNHRIREIHVSGDLENLRKARQGYERLMFVINHPSHSDAQVLSEVHRRLGVDSCYMAAYDVFLRHKFCAWSMQKMGNFSIDREGSDRKAMAAAIKVLSEGRTALNIFPEGNVYLTNDRITPFLDGAAFIALKAQAAMADVPVKIVPVSLKYTHLTTPRETITARMMELGKDCGYSFAPDSTKDPIRSILGLGQHILRGYLNKHGSDSQIAADGLPLYELLKTFTEELVSSVEVGLDISPNDDSLLISRIAKARSKIHHLRTDLSAPPNPEIDGMADRAILSLSIHGYLTPYLTERPTIDRYDETVERIAEDFHSRAMPRTGPRRAMAHIHTPLGVGDFLSAAKGNMRNAISSLTDRMQTIVQSGVDELNAGINTPGATLLS